MLSRDEAAEREQSGQRYLVDETTAVTRFIFPYGLLVSERYGGTAVAAPRRTWRSQPKLVVVGESAYAALRAGYGGSAFALN